jgi:uncharacterized protein (TIGR03435 family)
MRPSIGRTVGLTLLAVVLAAAQTHRPVFSDFEVATIKPVGPDDPRAGRYIRMQGGHRFEVKNYTVNGLIAAAYDLSPRAISGGPGWSGSDLYDIVAKTPSDQRPTYEEQMVMLKRLLTDRFNLAIHREEKEYSIYELTVAKGGPKIRTSTAPFDEASNVTSTLYPARSGGVDHALLPAHKVTMQQFASELQRAILDRPVVDKTNLAGRYDFNLEWMPDDSQFGGQLPSGAPDSDKPGFFTAVQEQLGLRIEAARRPLAVLVIDKLDRPSEN